MDITKETSCFKSKVFGSFTPDRERIKFIKKHKWILKANHLSEHFQKSVKLDIFNQEIVFETFAVQNEKASAQKWIKNMKDGNYKDEVIGMTHYDSKGEEISKKIYHGLTVFGHKCYFDYESGDTAVDTVYVRYDKEVELKPVVCPLTGITHWISDEVKMPKWNKIELEKDIPEVIKLVVPDVPIPDKIKYPEIYNFKTPVKHCFTGSSDHGLGKLNKDFKLPSHKEDVIKQKADMKKRGITLTSTSGHHFEMTDISPEQSRKKKTPEVKKPLNLCTRKRLP